MRYVKGDSPGLIKVYDEIIKGVFKGDPSNCETFIADDGRRFIRNLQWQKEV